ncbi:MAG: hypothetical protein WCJ26_11330 [bacterium]
MDTRPAMNIDGFFGNIINSYESRIQKIQTAFQSSENITESSHFLFDNVHHSLYELKQERALLNSRLCENLAKNGSLRKKDYNTMMSGILSVLDEKEKEAEAQFLSFIDAQKATAQSLKNSLLDIKDITTQDNCEKISIIKEQLARISKLQEMRKEAVMKTFLDFQQMHNKMRTCLENLLMKGDQIMIKDIKKVKDQLINDIN